MAELAAPEKATAPIAMPSRTPMVSCARGDAVREHPQAETCDICGSAPESVTPCPDCRNAGEWGMFCDKHRAATEKAESGG